LEVDRLISAKPASGDGFERSVIELHRNAKRGGVQLRPPFFNLILTRFQPGVLAPFKIGLFGRVLTRLKPGENEKSVIKYTLDYLDELPDLSRRSPNPS
jgi:hypothetical protein